jgi:H+/gluconate symporter-like permease
METWLRAFKEIAVYLRHPLVLIGFALLLVFSVHHSLIDAGIIPPLDQQAGSAVVQAILRYGFWIAIVVIVLGFSLQFFKQRRTSGRKAINKSVVAHRDIHARDIKIGDSTREVSDKEE